MEKLEPLVSIIIPVYNGSDYMREAIDSALAQTYGNTEVIVVNDGSTDGGETERIALSYGDRIRYISRPNGGVSAALNTGIANMRGEYFSWLSHDDVYTPDKVELEVRALPQHDRENTVVICSFSNIDEKSEPVKTVSGRFDLPANQTLSWESALFHLLDEGCFHGCTLLIPKGAFDRCGGFDEDMRFNQDGFMWLKIFINGYSLHCIPDVCVKGRIHSGQLTHKNQSLFHSDCEKMSAFLIPEFERISTKERNFLVKYIKYSAKYSNKGVARQAYLCAERRGLLDLKQKILIRAVGIWGSLRPHVRRAYYAMFHRVKNTQGKT